jgi:hypothetical protein
MSLDPQDAPDLMEREREQDAFKKRAAILIAVLAMLLAVTGLGGSNSMKDALLGNIEASNAFSFYQAKNMRQTSYELAADEIETIWLNDPSLSEGTRSSLRKKLDEYKTRIARYESEPATGEGKKELLVRARELEARRDQAIRKDPYFDYAQALLQIAIVLISVAIVADQRWLVALGGALGALGTLLMINGFLLLVTIPGLG